MPCSRPWELSGSEYGGIGISERDLKRIEVLSEVRTGFRKGWKGRTNCSGGDYTYSRLGNHNGYADSDLCALISAVSEKPV
jgi:hypothetical protein